MERRSLGLSGVASALLTIMLLVAGFAASAGLLSAVYVSQAEAMRKAVNVGEAVSERLQAYVYEDVTTNRTLLTVRNVGSTGSEVEYLMAVGYGGEVLAEVRLAETLKLGTQQALTVPLADLLGPEFDNYNQVRSVMATLYLKTVKGGVFGSGYMAPPSVMTASYATSTTTITTEETHTETLPIETGTWTVTSWTATVILNNPDHWPVESYVGVAFADRFSVANKIQSGGFPSWGLQPGLQARNPEGRMENVTSAEQVRIPRYVACWKPGGGSVYDRRLGWVGSIHGWGGTSPVTKFSELGPTYIVPVNAGGSHGRIFCRDGDELFEPRGTTLRYRQFVVPGPNIALYGTYTTTMSRVVPITFGGPGTATVHTWIKFLVTHVITYTHAITPPRTNPPTTLTWTTTFTPVFTVEDTWLYATVTATTATTITLETTRTYTIPWSFVTVRSWPDLYVTVGGDYRDFQFATFPRTITATRTCEVPCEYYERHDFKLAYIKAVSLWNTTEVLAYLDASQGDSTIELRVDRPVGLAAVYVYHSSSSFIPTPPSSPPGRPGCIDRVYVCPTYGYGSAIQKTSSSIKSGPCDSMDREVTVTFRCTNPNDDTCGAWVAPGPGTYSKNQLQKCNKSPDGTVTCTAPAGSTIIAGQAQ